MGCKAVLHVCLPAFSGLPMPCPCVGTWLPWLPARQAHPHRGTKSKTNPPLYLLLLPTTSCWLPLLVTSNKCLSEALITPELLVNT